MLLLGLIVGDGLTANTSQNAVLMEGAWTNDR